MSVATAMRRLGDEIQVAYDERIATIATTQRDVAALRARTADFLADCAARDDERRDEVEALRVHTADFLADCAARDDDRRDEVQALRAHTADFLADCRTRDMERRDEVEELKTRTAELLSQFRADMAEGRQHWQRALGKMAQKRRRTARLGPTAVLTEEGQQPAAASSPAKREKPPSGRKPARAKRTSGAAGR